MARPLGIIGVPSSAGSYAPGQEHAPRALRDIGLLPQLEAAGFALIDHGDAPVWRWSPDRESPRAQNAAAVADCAAATAERVRIALAAGDWPLVLGGDCTVGVGTLAGHLPSDDRVGLVYLDLHADLNTPDTVIDGALDWMGVAHLLGEAERDARIARLRALHAAARERPDRPARLRRGAGDGERARPRRAAPAGGRARRCGGRRPRRRRGHGALGARGLRPAGRALRRRRHRLHGCAAVREHGPQHRADAGSGLRRARRGARRSARERAHDHRAQPAPRRRGRRDADDLRREPGGRARPRAGAGAVACRAHA